MRAPQLETTGLEKSQLLIGYYYPAVVYVGENGLLYCVYEFQDEIEVFHTPSEIFESYLKGNVPVGIDNKPIKADRNVVQLLTFTV